MNPDLLIECSNDCPTVVLPVLETICNPEGSMGRISELLFLPCDVAIATEADLLALPFWQTNFKDAGFRGRRTLQGTAGSIAVANQTALDLGINCGLLSVVGSNTTFELTHRVLLMDKSADFITHAFYDALVKGAINNYKIFARYCDAPDNILPIGKVALTSYVPLIPDAVDDLQTFELKFQWKQKGIPTPITVAGLSQLLG
jgi:hypothetical protein